MYAGIRKSTLCYLLIGIIETCAVKTKFRIYRAVNQITELLSDAETLGAIWIGIVITKIYFVCINNCILCIRKITCEEEIEIAV